MTKFHCLIVFTSGDIGQYLNCDCLLTRLCLQTTQIIFYSNSDIRYLFATMDDEPRKIAHWFNANKLSLNIEKTKYTFS